MAEIKLTHQFGKRECKKQLKRKHGSTKRMNRASFFLLRLSRHSSFHWLFIIVVSTTPVLCLSPFFISSNSI